MRGLTDEEREHLRWGSLSVTEVPSRALTAAEELVRDNLIARGLLLEWPEYSPDLGFQIWRGHITAAGKLALELDTIARSGKVEV